MFKKIKRIKKNKEKTWVVYSDKIGDNPAIIRVDSSYTYENFIDTLSVNIRYDSTNDDKLPDMEQKSFIYEIENIILNKIKSDNLNIYFLGTASFNSATYLIFVTNEYIDWKSFIERLIPSSRIESEIYSEDNMGYYNSVLYPKSNR